MAVVFIIIIISRKNIHRHVLCLFANGLESVLKQAPKDIMRMVFVLQHIECPIDIDYYHGLIKG
jgi:hypothetical protein